MSVAHLLRRTLLGWILVGNWACGGSALIVSSQSLSATEHLTRLYIGVEQRSLDAESPEVLGDTLCRELKKRHVVAKSRVLRGVSADELEAAEREASDDADRFHAQAFLLLQLVRGSASPSGSAAVSYDGILGTRATPKPTWRVRVRGRRGSLGGSTRGMMEAVAERLAEQMEKDGVIEGVRNAKP